MNDISAHMLGAGKQSVSIAAHLDVNGNLLFGAPPFQTFDEIIQAALP